MTIRCSRTSGSPFSTRFVTNRITRSTIFNPTSRMHDLRTRNALVPMNYAPVFDLASADTTHGALRGMAYHQHWDPSMWVQQGARHPLQLNPPASGSTPLTRPSPRFAYTWPAWWPEDPSVSESPYVTLEQYGGLPDPGASAGRGEVQWNVDNAFDLSFTVCHPDDAFRHVSGISDAVRTQSNRGQFCFGWAVVMLYPARQACRFIENMNEAENARIQNGLNCPPIGFFPFGANGPPLVRLTDRSLAVFGLSHFQAAFTAGRRVAKFMRALNSPTSFHASAVQGFPGFRLDDEFFQRLVCEQASDGASNAREMRAIYA